MTSSLRGNQCLCLTSIIPGSSLLLDTFVKLQRIQVHHCSLCHEPLPAAMGSHVCVTAWMQPTEKIRFQTSQLALMLHTISVPSLISREFFSDEGTYPIVWPEYVLDLSWETKYCFYIYMNFNCFL